MKNRLKTQESNRCFLSAGHLQPYLDSFTGELSNKGYKVLTINSYYNSVAHLAIWLKKKHVAIENIDNTVLDKFEKHKCHCPGGRKGCSISSKYADRARRFVEYLFHQGIISSEINLSDTEKKELHIVEKFKTSLQNRGLSDRTIATYEYSICKLLPILGNDTRNYSAKKIRQTICDIAKKSSCCELKKLTTALRVYLRFLTVENLCHPDLDAAVPTVAEWKLSSLPKYITEEEVNKVIASCNIHSPQGMRDRAIILLLSCLGLRAGDVSNMKIDDINWSESTIRVCGKGRRESRLPLLQEVGDALLTYLEKGRPPATIDKLFLCLNAPYRAFLNSSSISSVVRLALTRADIQHPPFRGANLLRHSAATNMLRKGATLETISAMLRHRSLDMTGYYAKVDVPRLIQIAQPWPEGAPC